MLIIPGAGYRLKTRTYLQDYQINESHSDPLPIQMFNYVVRLKPAHDTIVL